MKKLSLLLTLMLTMCSFAACGNNNDDSDDKESSSSVSRKDKDDDKEDDEKDDDRDDAGFSRGTVADNIYTNEFSGIAFETPDDWKIYSDEEIRQTMGIGLEAGGSSLDADKLAAAAVVDFAAVNEGTGESITFTYEDASKFPDNYTIDNYIAGFKLSTKAAMPNADIDWHVDGEKVELCGIEFDVFGADIELEEYGIEISQEYCIGEVNGYMMSIAYTSGYTSSSMEDYYGCFKD